MNIDFNNNVFTSVYDSCPFWSSQFVYTVLDKIILSEDAFVLDVGTGTGVPAIEIAERMGKNSVVYAIDHWETALRRAELKASQLDVKNVIFKKASVLDIPYQDGFFDCVVSNNCLNNVADFDEALNECHRVLKTGGRLIQMFNLPESLKEFYDIYRELLSEKEMVDEIDALNRHIFEKRKSTAFTAEATIRAGFNIVEATEHCFPWRFYNGTSLLNYSFVKMAWLPNWQKIVNESQRDKLFTELEEKLNVFAKYNNGLNLKIPYACIVADKLEKRRVHDEYPSNYIR